MTNQDDFFCHPAEIRGIPMYVIRLLTFRRDVDNKTRAALKSIESSIKGFAGTCRCNIEILGDSTAPRVAGARCHTKKRTNPKLRSQIYVRSTYRVEVGIFWIQDNYAGKHVDDMVLEFHKMMLTGK